MEKYPKYVDNKILEITKKTDFIQWESTRQLCTYLGEECGTSWLYAYNIARHLFPRDIIIKGYSQRIAYKDSIAKFMSLHRRGYVVKIMGRVFYSDKGYNLTKKEMIKKGLL